MSSWIKPRLKQIFAVVALAGLYWATLAPGISTKEKLSLVSHFQFQRTPLPQVAGYPSKTVRSVNPRLAQISAWISSVGAAVALGDIDGDGLPNDVCYVDTRTDQVIVSAVPGTPERYQPFVMNPAPLPYDQNTMAPMGCLALDLNEDGLTDIVVYYWGRSPIVFLRTQSSRQQSLNRDSFVARDLLPVVEDWYTNAGTAADLDGDGHVDLVFGNYFADGSRILDVHSNVPAEMHNTFSRASNGGTKHFLLWQGATTGDSPTVNFSDQKNVLEGTAKTGWTLAMGTCDLDGDMLPEIYIANDLGPDVVLHNLSTPGHLRFQQLVGKRTFTTPASNVMGKDSFKGMGIDFGDLNYDGIPDMAVSNITSEFALEESNLIFVSTGDFKSMQKGIAPYKEVSEPLGLARSGWSWDIRFGDFDNQGSLQILQATGFVKGSANRWPELHELAMGNDNVVRDPAHWPNFRPGDDLSGNDHNRFFVRSSSGRFFDLSNELGLADPQTTRGIATADVDGDGLLDFAIANQWEDSVFYHNRSKAAGNFLQLYLLLPVGQSGVSETRVLPGHPAPGTLGRYAIGATATLHLRNGKRFISQVDAGSGHSGKRSPELHFGLGYMPSSQPVVVDLCWRDNNGKIHRETLKLMPGLHTILLGTSDEKTSERKSS
jgi:hypothetical protein